MVAPKAGVSEGEKREMATRMASKTRRNREFDQFLIFLARGGNRGPAPFVQRTEVIDMMKKIGLGLLIATLCAMSCAALAEPGRIDDRLFDTAKQTLHCLDTGDYQKASALLGCTDADSLAQLVADNFTTLGYGEAQTRISVAFIKNDKWYLAVPTREPSSDDVEALVLNCGSGSCASDVSFALWGSVAGQLDASGAVIWNEEYAADVVVIED